MASVERAATSRRIDAADWAAFRAVARRRSARGLEIIPNMAACPDLKNDAAELNTDESTLRMMRKAGISASDYLDVGWALLVASDPEFFAIRGDPVVAANAAFIAGRRAQVLSLLEGR